MLCAGRHLNCLYTVKVSTLSLSDREDTKASSQTVQKNLLDVGQQSQLWQAVRQMGWWNVLKHACHIHAERHTGLTYTGFKNDPEFAPGMSQFFSEGGHKSAFIS